MDDHGALAGLLRAHRESAGLTQQQLATQAGMSLGALQDVEQGRTARPRGRSLDRLAMVLRLTPDEHEELLRAGRNQRGGAGMGQAATRTGPAQTGNGSGVRVEVLGPLAAWRDGQPVPLGPVRQRAVLGLLTLHADTGLHRAAISDALWGGDPPRTAVAMIQAQVGRVRRLLGPVAAAGRARLAWDGSCYRLSLDGVGLDLAEFSDLTEQARQAVAAGNATASCGLYRRSLALWRGQALEDIDMLCAYPAVTTLARRRDEVVIEYASAATGAGLQDQVIIHLAALVAREPLDERAHAQLMLALAATGRQGAALGVYQDLVSRLDAELGVRPGPELAAAHMQILRQQVPLALAPVAGRAAIWAARLTAAPDSAAVLDWQGHRHDWAAAQRTALAAATRQDDKDAQATARRAFAAACMRLADYGEAYTQLTACLDIYMRLGDQAGESRIQRDLGNLFEYQGRYAEALDHAECALTLSQAIADLAGQAAALTDIGRYRTMLGLHRQALTYCRRALRLHRELGARHGEAHTWISLGQAHCELGSLTKAAACHRQALGLFQELGDRVYEAAALTHLGDAHLAAGRTGAAHETWQQALDILDELRHPDAAGVRSRLSRCPGDSDGSPAAAAAGYLIS